MQAGGPGNLFFVGNYCFLPVRYGIWCMCTFLKPFVHVFACCLLAIFKGAGFVDFVHRIICDASIAENANLHFAY